MTSNRLDQYQIEYVPPSQLVVRDKHPRKHSRKQIGVIAKSMATVGNIVPLIVDDHNVVFAGAARLEAAKLNGDALVPIIRLSNVSEADLRAFALADNRLVEMGEWDLEIVTEEIQSLAELEIGFDLSDLGFSLSEAVSAGSGEPEPPVELPGDAPVVSEIGDLWIIGEHRLLCGNALDHQCYERLLGSERAQMVFTDPPYNVPIAGNVSGLGKVKHREFVMASGEKSSPGFTEFLRTAMKRMAEYSASTAIHFICIDWKHVGEMQEAGKSVYSELKNICVWAKTNAGMGTMYRGQHELIFVYKVGKGRHINNFGLGETGRYRTNLWTYAGANTFRKGREEDLAAHPTVKPVQMVEDAILDCSKPNGVILDPFVGSGTTLHAAHRAGRRGYGMELDPAYVDCAVRRLQKALQVEARLEDGRTFAEVEQQRCSKQEAA